jgi:hypothetical protein
MDFTTFFFLQVFFIPFFDVVTTLPFAFPLMWDSPVSTGKTELLVEKAEVSAVKPG